MIKLQMQATREQKYFEKTIADIAQATRKEIGTIIVEASKIFAREAGKAMIPRGKMAHDKKARNRARVKVSLANVYYHGGHARDIKPGKSARPKGKYPPVYQIKVGADKKTRKRLWFWTVAATKNYMRIGSRDVAKAQFWEILKDLGQKSYPRGAYAGDYAKRAANQETMTIIQKSDMAAATRMTSDIDTAADYRPVAETVGFLKGQTQLHSWLNRLLAKNKRRWDGK